MIGYLLCFILGMISVFYVQARAQDGDIKPLTALVSGFTQFQEQFALVVASAIKSSKEAKGAKDEAEDSASEQKLESTSDKKTE